MTTTQRAKGTFVHNRIAGAVVVAAFLFLGILPTGALADGHDWADPSSAPIRPGVRVNTAGSLCTSNFIFTAGPDVYIGVAAHCYTTSGATETNGCLAGSHPLGSTASITGATRAGTLVYSSWIAMQAAGEDPNSSPCRYNDFALIRLHPDDIPRVSPAMLFFGGPEAIAPSAGPTNKVITYGNTPLRPGIGVSGVAHTHAREGYVLTSAGGGWSHQVYTVTPGVPGDSGSGVMTGDGRALGILVTVYALPFPASNGVTNLARALDYAQTATGVPYTLATWDLINPGLLPA